MFRLDQVLDCESPMTTAPDPSFRASRKFDWAAVNHSLLRRLLIAVYEAAGRDEVASLIRTLSTDQLIRQANRSIGRPPHVSHMDAMFDVLRTYWLPTLDGEELEAIVWDVQLSLSGPDRNVTPRTKTAKLEFLARRRRTETFKLHLRASFVRNHKVDSTTAGGSAQQPGHQHNVLDLLGLGLGDRRTPFPHQTAAWKALDALAASRSKTRSGLLVLPTGAGKTSTLSGWLLRRMSEQPQTRVLWIADQQELVDQAARSFEDHASYLPADFARRLRVVHGAANPSTALGDEQLDVACITRQSIVGRQLDAGARGRLAAFSVGRPWSSSTKLITPSLRPTASCLK
jgi:hypothetical protein